MKMLEFSVDKELVEGGTRSWWVESVPWGGKGPEMSCRANEVDDMSEVSP